MAEKTLNILLIEDNPADARLVKEFLSENPTSYFHVHWEKTLELGLQSFAADSYDLVLLDLELPDSGGGLATVEKALAASSGVPIIVMTGREDEDLAAAAVRGGAQDYLIKNTVAPAILFRSIDYAIERQRAREALRESEERFHRYADRLSLLHEIGLTLNQQTDRYRLLESILSSAAEMTSAGVGAMLLVNENTTELVSIYYAPWYESRCTTDKDVSALHERFDQLMPDKTLNAFRIPGFPGAGARAGLPAGHPHLRGLLIGRLVDTLERTKGYFLLSDKKAGMDFTREDVDTISLLAAQSSVALVSAENLAREHAVADTLQASLLPEIPRHEKLDIGLLYRSASRVGRIGGDFYDFVELEGDKVAFSVGDVSGKGLKAATYTAMVKYTLRAHLESGMAPGDCLSRLNTVVARDIAPDKFITIGLVVLDIARKTMSYSLAGHPEPILSRARGMIEMSSPRTLPLGVLPHYSYPTLKISITDDTTLLMYTDGLIEARSSEGEQFGFERLQTALESRRCLPAQTIARNLVDRVVEFSGDHLQDDVAVVVVRPKLAAE